MKECSKKCYLLNKNIQDAIVFFLLSIFIAAYALFNHYSSKKIEWKTSPYLFPILIAIFIALISLSLLNDGIKEIKSKVKSINKTPVQWKDVFFTIAVSIAYYRIMVFISFIPATILFLASMFVYLREGRIWLIALISFICSFSIYGIFAVLLNVMLP